MSKISEKLKKYEDTIVITLHSSDDLFQQTYTKMTSVLDVILDFTEANEKHDEIYYKVEINKILKALNKVGIRVAFCIDEVSIHLQFKN